jgi:hypothetical protein
MNFKTHSEIRGEHAFLSPSKYHWINYDEEKLSSTYLKFLAIQKGVEYHELAYRAIRLGVKLPKSKKAFNMYVNDAIGYRMIPEQILYYSDNCFGTADTISFRDNLLRIHDLKTGVSPVSMHQLEIYASIFCLEYDAKPRELDIELRIYQIDNVLVHNPDYEDIMEIMNKIIIFDKKIEQLNLEEELSWLKN